MNELRAVAPRLRVSREINLSEEQPCNQPFVVAVERFGALRAAAPTGCAATAWRSTKTGKERRQPRSAKFSAAITARGNSTARREIVRSLATLIPCPPFSLETALLITDQTLRGECASLCGATRTGFSGTIGCRGPASSNRGFIQSTHPAESPNRKR